MTEYSSSKQKVSTIRLSLRHPAYFRNDDEPRGTTATIERRRSSLEIYVPALLTYRMSKESRYLPTIADAIGGDKNEQHLTMRWIQTLLQPTTSCLSAHDENPRKPTTTVLKRASLIWEDYNRSLMDRYQLLRGLLAVAQ